MTILIAFAAFLAGFTLACVLASGKKVPPDTEWRDGTDD